MLILWTLLALIVVVVPGCYQTRTNGEKIDILSAEIKKVHTLNMILNRIQVIAVQATKVLDKLRDLLYLIFRYIFFGGRGVYVNWVILERGINF